MISAPAVADPCPVGPDHAARLDQIIFELGRANGHQAARPLSQELWELWLDAPVSTAQAILDEGMTQRESFDFLGARTTLDGLVAYCLTMPKVIISGLLRAFCNVITTPRCLI